MHRLQNSRIDRAVSLPAVGTLLNEPAYAELVGEYGRSRVVEAIREQIASERSGEADGSQRHAAVTSKLRAAVAPNLRWVINATGVILHTNLGRAPLSRAAMDALAVAAGYSNLELDLARGKRGERAALVGGLLTSLFKCEAALVVNNNAAAVLLTLTALCRGKEVIVSRGQLGDEPTVAESLQHSDVVTFSGDKLLGGPQAGIVLGRGEKGADAVKKMARHPLARAVRIDKLTLAALEATLSQRLTGHADQIPVERMLHTPVADVRRRAAMWSVKLAERGVETRLIEGSSAVGGGSLPEHDLPTVLLAVAGPAPRLATPPRPRRPPVRGRLEKAAGCLAPRPAVEGDSA